MGMLVKGKANRSNIGGGIFHSAQVLFLEGLAGSTIEQNEKLAVQKVACIEKIKERYHI